MNAYLFTADGEKTRGVVTVFAPSLPQALAAVAKGFAEHAQPDEDVAVVELLAEVPNLDKPDADTFAAVDKIAARHPDSNELQSLGRELREALARKGAEAFAAPARA